MILLYTTGLMEKAGKTRELSKITLLIVVFAVAMGVTFVTNAEDFGLAVKERRKK